MSFKIYVCFCSLILATALGTSFPALGQSNEDTPCEGSLIGTNANGPQVEIKLLNDKILSQGAHSLLWKLHPETGLWFVTVDRVLGTVRLYQPDKLNEPREVWHNLDVNGGISPHWLPDETLWIGSQGMQFDYVAPSRVRIMPVGRWLPEYETASGERVRAVNSAKGLELTSDHRVTSIPFATWENLVPQWITGIDGESLLIAVDMHNELNILSPLSHKPAVKVALSGKEPKNPQVLRRKNGEVLILSRETLFSFDGSKVSPIAVVADGFIFEGLKNEEWLAWSEKSSERVVVKIGLLDGLTTPAFRVDLEDGESVRSYSYIPEVSERGQFVIMTNRRVLQFVMTSH